MTDTPPKPKRRLWQWLVAVAALLISLAYLASRPELDNRLSGRWGFNSSAYTLTANGRGEWTENSDGSGATHKLRWWMDGPVLVIDRRRGGVADIVRDLENASRRIARRLDVPIWYPDTDYTSFYVTKIDLQSIRYRTVARDMQTPVGSEQVLKRIPE